MLYQLSYASSSAALADRHATPKPELQDSRAGTLLLRAYHGTGFKVSTRNRAEQTGQKEEKKAVETVGIPAVDVSQELTS